MSKETKLLIESVVGFGLFVAFIVIIKNREYYQMSFLTGLLFSMCKTTKILPLNEQSTSYGHKADFLKCCQ